MDKGPDAFRTISEVAEDLDLPQHVLRFWETRFSQIKPLKRGGGRRYYRPDDVDLLRGIRHLLYGEGYTIKGVQRILKEEGVRYVETVWQQGAAKPAAHPDDFAEETDEAFGHGDPARTFAPEPEDEGDLMLDDGMLGAATVAPAPPARPGGPAVRSDLEMERPAVGSTHQPAPAGINQAQMRALQAVLAELAECRRLLQAARRGPDGDDQ